MDHGIAILLSGSFLTRKVIGIQLNTKMGDAFQYVVLAHITAGRIISKNKHLLTSTRSSRVLKHARRYLLANTKSIFKTTNESDHHMYTRGKQ
jgi:hypothetical protein